MRWGGVQAVYMSTRVRRWKWRQVAVCGPDVCDMGVAGEICQWCVHLIVDEVKEEVKGFSATCSHVSLHTSSAMRAKWWWLVSSAAAVLDVECSSRCACLSGEASRTFWQTSRAARHTGTSVETGMLDNEALDDTQQRAAAAMSAVTRLFEACGQPSSSAACALPSAARRRKICGCRATRLMNVTANLQRRLDDSAAGALFGDSEETMTQLATAMAASAALAERVAAELDRFSANCSLPMRPRARADPPLRHRHRERMARRGEEDLEKPQLDDAG